MNNVCYALHHRFDVNKDRDILANNIISKMSSFNIPRLESQTVFINSQEDMDYYVDKNIEVLGSMPFGAIGLYMSNYNVWNNFLKSEYEYLIVFEDDAIINDNFYDIVSQILEYLNDNVKNNIVSLYSHPSQYSQYSDIHQLNSDLLCWGYAFRSSPGYLIDKEAAQSIIHDTNNNGIKFPIDLYLFNYLDSICNVFGIRPSIDLMPIGVEYLDDNGFPINLFSTIQNTKWFPGSFNYHYIQDKIPNSS